MSTTQQGIVDILRTNQILGYWQAGASALILYEYVITLPHEIYLFWYRGFTATVILFFFARYVAIVYAIASLLLLNGRETALSCEAVNQFFVVSGTLVFITSNAFSASRMFAVSGRRWLPTLAILFLGLVPVTVEIYHAAAQSNAFVVFLVVGQPLCAFTNSISQSLVNKLVIASRVTVILSDVITLSVTWRYVYRVKRNAIKRVIHSPLAIILLKTGVSSDPFTTKLNPDILTT